MKNFKALKIVAQYVYCVYADSGLNMMQLTDCIY